MMVAGTVSVADDGTVTFSPDDATSMAKAKFVAERAVVEPIWIAQGNPIPVDALKALAAAANAHGAWLVPYLQGAAHAKIAADATGDGLQAGTTHPAVDKLLPIV